MGLNIKELRKIVNFCRKNGVIHLKNDNIEVTISERALKLPKPKMNTNNNFHLPGMPDLTLWSSGGIGEQSA